MPTPATIHRAEYCPLSEINCALHVTLDGVDGCLHHSLDWPVNPDQKMPERCPCVPAVAAIAAGGVPQRSPKQLAAARRSRSWRSRWS